MRPLSAVLCLHAQPLSCTTRKRKLLLASYLFCAAWNPPYVVLLGISAVVDWYAAQGFAAQTLHW